MIHQLVEMTSVRSLVKFEFTYPIYDQSLKQSRGLNTTRFSPRIYVKLIYTESLD